MSAFVTAWACHSHIHNAITFALKRIIELLWGTMSRNTSLSLSPPKSVWERSGPMVRYEVGGTVYYNRMRCAVGLAAAKLRQFSGSNLVFIDTIRDSTLTEDSQRATFCINCVHTPPVLVKHSAFWVPWSPWCLAVHGINHHKWGRRALLREP